MINTCKSLQALFYQKTATTEPKMSCTGLRRGRVRYNDSVLFFQPQSPQLRGNSLTPTLLYDGLSPSKEDGLPEARQSVP